MMLPERKRTHLKEFDYSQSGAYFITVCTQNKRCLLSRIVCAFKSLTTIECKKHGFNGKLFQSSFYDHVIRNETDYNEIAGYIEQNPLKWELDKLYTKE